MDDSYKNSSNSGEHFFILVLCVIIAVTAWTAIYNIEQKEKARLEQTLKNMLRKSHVNIRSRLLSQKKSASTWANYAPIQSIAIELLSLPQDEIILSESEPQKRLRQLMTPVKDAAGYQGYFLISKNLINIASSRNGNIGKRSLLSSQTDFLEKVLSGNAAISLPQASDVPLEDIHGNMVEGLATMFVASPVKDSNDNIIGIFALRLDPDEIFGATFKFSRFGNTGETYAFDDDGLLISESRFNDDLKNAGIIKDNHADLAIYIRDPGVNLAEGKKLQMPIDQRPLTIMAISATKGNNSTNLEGYNDYRGVPVIGAWQWDSDLGFGIATEIDVDEAYSAYRSTRFVVIVSTLLSIVVLLVFAIRSTMSRAKLTAAEKKYRDSISSTREGYLVINSKTQILEVNSALCQMLCYEPEELIGRHVSEFLADVGPEQLEKSIKDSIHTIISTEHHHYAIDFLTKHGSRVHLLVNATSTTDNNITTGAFAFISDTTELEKARIDADSANKAKSKFLSSMSHELRTPLNAVVGFSQLLLFDSKTRLIEEDRVMVQHILDGGEHLIELINEILDLANIEAGKIQLQKEEIDLVKLIFECQAYLNVLASDRGITLQVNDMTEDQSIYADPLRVKQILINLISNAIKYNRENGLVTISIEQATNEMIRINVSDTGYGIPKNRISELFKPFSRLGAEFTPIEGTGIGLVVCKDLVTLQGGTIGVESSVGEGSIFWIEMPSIHCVKDSIEAEVSESN